MKANDLPQNAKSALLTYRKAVTAGFPSHPYPEFLLYVDVDTYRGYQKDPGTVGLVNVCETNEVFFIRTGSNSGQVERPSKGDLEETFGTSDFGEIVRFMLEHGDWKPFEGHHHLGLKNPMMHPKDALHTRGGG